MGMGAKMTSQVQDVVVAGSQSSNFLLPKENSGKASSIQWLYNGGPTLKPSNQTKPGEVSGLCAGLA